MSGKSEWSIDIRDKKNERDYKLLILNDKNIKIVRIILSKDYAQFERDETINKHAKNQQPNNQNIKLNLEIDNLGFSIVNNLAREIAYLHFKKFRVK